MTSIKKFVIFHKRRFPFNISLWLFQSGVFQVFNHIQIIIYVCFRYTDWQKATKVKQHLWRHQMGTGWRGSFCSVASCWWHPTSTTLPLFFLSFHFLLFKCLLQLSSHFLYFPIPLSPSCVVSSVNTYTSIVETWNQLKQSTNNISFAPHSNPPVTI